MQAIRRGNVIAHRRWMIRAFAIGVGVGTIRIWIQVFYGTGLLDFRDSFGVAFWLAFVLHVLGAEWWLRATPRRTDDTSRPWLAADPVLWSFDDPLGFAPIRTGPWITSVRAADVDSRRGPDA